LDDEPDGASSLVAGDEDPLLVELEALGAAGVEDVEELEVADGVGGVEPPGADEDEDDDVEVELGGDDPDSAEGVAALDAGAADWLTALSSAKALAIGSVNDRAPTTHAAFILCIPNLT
jgi:hypothetical protein